LINNNEIHKKYVFDIPSSSKDEGIELQIFSYHGEINQQFLIENVGFSEYVIRALVSNKVLEVKGKELGEKNVIQVFQTNEESQLTEDLKALDNWFEDLGFEKEYTMKKGIIAIAAIIVLILAAIGYVVWPRYDELSLSPRMHTYEEICEYAHGIDNTATVSEEFTD